MIYAIISQVIMLITNLSILINERMELEFYKIYYMSIPVVLYTVFYVIFYISNWKMQLETESYTVKSFITMVAIFVNILYCIIETIIERPDNPWLFFICTVFIQIINIIVSFNIIRVSASEVTTPAGTVVLQIFNYLTLFLAAYSMYTAVFTRIEFTVIIMIATSVFATITMYMYLFALRNQIMLDLASEASDDDEDEDEDEFYENIYE